MFAFGAPSAPVANWGVLGFLEASTIYNFIYNRFPSTAGSGSSPLMAPTSAELALGQVAAFIPGHCPWNLRPDAQDHERCIAVRQYDRHRINRGPT